MTRPAFARPSQLQLSSTYMLRPFRRHQARFRNRDHGTYVLIKGPFIADAPAILAQPRRPVPVHISRPVYAEDEVKQRLRNTNLPERMRYYKASEDWEQLIDLGSRDEKSVREAARLAAKVLSATGEQIAKKV